MFTRILLKSFRGRDSRQLVAFLAVVIATSVAATLLTIRADTSAKINVELRAYGANLLLMPVDAEIKPTFSVSRIMQYPWPVSNDTIRGVAPVLYGVVNFIDHAVSLNQNAVVTLGTDFTAMRRVNSFWDIQPPIADLQNNEILIGQAAARKFGLSTGQWVKLKAVATSDAADFRIAGIVTTGENEDDQFILSLNALQKMLALPDEATLALISVQGGSQITEKLAADISRRLTEIKAKPVRKIAESETHILKILTLLMSIVTAFTVIVATLCLGATMTALIVERRQEVGIMKAIGAENRHLTRLVIAEMVLLGLSGGLVGYWFGIFFAQIISKNVFNSYVALRVEILPVVLILALGISLVAAIFPLRRALQIEPIIVLRGE